MQHSRKRPPEVPTWTDSMGNGYLATHNTRLEPLTKASGRAFIALAYNYKTFVIIVKFTATSAGVARHPADRAR